jgi:hypothetical protein
MNAKSQARELVNLVKVYRNGQQESASMPRWMAEMEIGCIPLDQPNVARARIEPIHVDRQAAYPVKRVNFEQIWYIALHLADFLPAPLVA